MTLDEVKARLDEIAAEAKNNDDESAHAKEDELWRDVLAYLADQGNALAGLALKSQDITFSRWYA